MSFHWSCFFCTFVLGGMFIYCHIGLSLIVSLSLCAKKKNKKKQKKNKKKSKKTKKEEKKEKNIYKYMRTYVYSV